MMKLFCLKALFLLALVSLFGGCTSGMQFGDIVVEVTSYKPSATNGQAQVTLRYINDNAFPIAIRATSGRLYLNNEFFGTVHQLDPVGLPQTGTSIHAATLTIEKPGVLGKIQASGNPSVSYRLETLLVVEVAEEKERVKFSRTGQLDAAVFRGTPEAK